MSGDRRMERMQSDIEDLRKVRVKVIELWPKIVRRVRMMYGFHCRT